MQRSYRQLLRCLAAARSLPQQQHVGCAPQLRYCSSSSSGAASQPVLPGCLWHQHQVQHGTMHAAPALPVVVMQQQWPQRRERSWAAASLAQLVQLHSAARSGTQRRLCSSSSSGHPPDSSTTPTSTTKDMAIVFTCAKCDTRAVKAFSRQAYNNGLVLVRCPGCSSLHLIADNLGWFEDGGFKIEEHLAAKGQAVKRVRLDEQQQQQQQQQGGGQAEQLTAEDMAGWSKVQQLLSTVASAASEGGSQHHQQQQQQQQEEQQSHSSDSASSSTDAAGQVAQAAQAAAGAAFDGVVQLAPDDVEAWVRVQNSQQQQKEDA